MKSPKPVEAWALQFADGKIETYHRETRLDVEHRMEDMISDGCYCEITRAIITFTPIPTKRKGRRK